MTGRAWDPRGLWRSLSRPAPAELEQDGVCAECEKPVAALPVSRYLWRRRSGEVCCSEACAILVEAQFVFGHRRTTASPTQD